MEAMLAAVDYRGDASDHLLGNGMALGYRYFAERAHRSPGIHRGPVGSCACAGRPAASSASSAARVVAISEGRRPGRRIGLETVLQRAHPGSRLLRHGLQDGA